MGMSTRSFKGRFSQESMESIKLSILNGNETELALLFELINEVTDFEKEVESNLELFFKLIEECDLAPN